jgi:hypothetical protein
MFPWITSRIKPILAEHHALILMIRDLLRHNDESPLVHQHYLKIRLPGIAVHKTSFFFRAKNLRS